MVSYLVYQQFVTDHVREDDDTVEDSDDPVDERCRMLFLLIRALYEVEGENVYCDHDECEYREVE